MQVNPLRIDITNKSHVENIITEIQGHQNVHRKKRAFQAQQIVTGNQKFYIQDAVMQQFPDTWQKFRLGNISLAKKVISKKAKAYKNNPKRVLDTDEETEAYEEIFKEGKFSRAFKEADAIFNYYKYVCMWVSWIPKEAEDDEARAGTYHVRALKPYEYDLIRDPRTGEPLIFIMSLPDSDITGFVGNNDSVEQTITESQADVSAQTEKYALWSKTQHVIVHKITTVVEVAGGGSEVKEEFKVISVNDGDVNPFAPMLPISFLSKDTSAEYPTENPLADQTINFNLGYSNLKTASDTQGHGQLVYKRPYGQKKSVMHMGLHTAIDVPLPKKSEVPQPDVNYINASPDLISQLEIVKFDASSILDENDITVKGAITGGADKFASGFDRLLSEGDCQDVIEDNQSLYADELEIGLFNIIKAAEATIESNIITSENISIQFPKPKVLISDKETLANIKEQNDQGLIFPHEKHMIMNPNLTEALAKEREEGIQEAKTEQMRAEATLQKELFPEQFEPPGNLM